MDVATEVDLCEEGFKEPVTRNVPVVCLVSLIKFLFSKSGIGICLDQSALDTFWGHALRFFPRGPGHPGLEHKAIPLGLYGDAAQYTSQTGFKEKVFGVTCNVLLWCPSSTRSSRFLLFAIRRSMIVTYKRTIWPVYKHLMKQLNLLHEGVMVDGKLLRFSLCEFRGDWEHHCASWNLARRWNGRNPCFKCHTGIRGNDSYVNFPDDITEFSHAHFIANILKPGQICAFATCKSAVDSFFELCTTDGWIRLLPNKTHLRSFSGSDGIPRINDQMVLVPQFKPWHLPSLQR